jgi:hypothetical protein
MAQFAVIEEPPPATAPAAEFVVPSVAAMAMVPAAMPAAMAFVGTVAVLSMTHEAPFPATMAAAIPIVPPITTAPAVLVVPISICVHLFPLGYIVSTVLLDISILALSTLSGPTSSTTRCGPIRIAADRATLAPLPQRRGNGVSW